MKYGLLAILLCILFISNVSSQEIKTGTVPLIGSDAPSFTAETTEGTINFPTDFGNKWKILFSHPRDFTPVCSSEIYELGQMQAEFSKIGVKLLVLSTDDLEKHKLWKANLEELSYKNRQPAKLKFPLAADSKATISKKYGMIHLSASSTKDVRGVFIINPQDKIEAIFFYPMNIGRNMDEIKRTVLALQASGKGDDRLLTPANWKLGDDMMTPQFPYTEKQLTENPAIKELYYSVGSYMWFKKTPPSL